MLSPSVSSNSGAWLPCPGFEYKPMLFEDPRNNANNNNSSKENMPPLENDQIPILNVKERDFLYQTEKLLGTDNRWEVHVAQQAPLPRTNSPCPSNNQPGSMEQLETFTEDNMDVRDFSERPPNNLRPPKPPKKIQGNPPKFNSTSRMSRFMVMNHVVMGIPKPPLSEIRSFLTEKKKVPIG